MDHRDTDTRQWLLHALTTEEVQDLAPGELRMLTALQGGALPRAPFDPAALPSMQRLTRMLHQYLAQHSDESVPRPTPVQHA